MRELARRQPSEVVRTTRQYRLALSPSAALERLAGSVDAAIVPQAQLSRPGRPRSSKPFMVISNENFVIYQPWESLLKTPEGVVVPDLLVGPAVVGRAVPTREGCIVEVHARPLAPTPRQAIRMGATLGGAALLFLAMVVAAGPHPILFAVAGVIALGTGVGLFSYRRDERRQDIRELLAIVERSFGPLELPPVDPGPLRGTRET